MTPSSIDRLSTACGLGAVLLVLASATRVAGGRARDGANHPSAVRSAADAFRVTAAVRALTPSRRGCRQRVRPQRHDEPGDPLVGRQAVRPLRRALPAWGMPHTLASRGPPV